MALKETNLMLPKLAWCICISSLHTEVIVYSATINSSRSLGNKFGTPHSLAVPVTGAVQRDLDTLRTASIRWILKARVEVDIRCDVFGAVLKILGL